MYFGKYSAVIGANGQDGFLMIRYLLKNNIKTLAIIHKNNEKLIEIKNKNLQIFKINQFNPDNFNIIKKYEIDNFYFFSGYSKIPKNKIEKEICIESNYKILKNFLVFFEKNYKKSKLLFLSSGEVFGKNQFHSKNENSKFSGDNCYSICKIKSHQLIDDYKKKKLFISIGICYNHESIYTPKSHLIPTIIKKLSSPSKQLKFYNVDEYRNFSHVYDFIPIFYKILKLKRPSNFIIANNTNYKIRDLIKLISNHLKIKKELKYVLKTSKSSRKANNIKIRNRLNYKPMFSTKKLIIRMCSYYKKGYFFK